MKVYRVEAYPPIDFPIDQHDLLVIQGPAWLCTVAAMFATQGWPTPAATAIQPDGDPVATVIDTTYNGRQWPIGSTVEV